ncbi:PEP/pyruvate-binding domain-containing protein [Desulfovibrio sp. JC010]|uniref:PEP/pyruvate-binding domain-containing protein n=1 Tax=Desulfovibrio sp. JC010 TaxID=2593641 RepID=UPI0013D6FFAF|nr:PEP/pyruvate-binding domain-containing protein [Desulfovibrio sp. JC010]NDV26833.1 pyruvate, water dikinase [Desulfovibrio sp. JC010]
MLPVNILKFWAETLLAPRALLQRKYEAFKVLLEYDSQALDLVADLEELFYGERLADRNQAGSLQKQLSSAVSGMIGELRKMHPYKFRDLPEAFQRIDDHARHALLMPGGDSGPPYTVPLAAAGECPELAGGKAANLGRVHALGHTEALPGFVVTANAFHAFVDHNNLREELNERLSRMEVDNVRLLSSMTLELQELFLNGEVPPGVAGAIERGLETYLDGTGKLAVRSSALAEDSEISFAGQYASELNVDPAEVLDGYKRVLAGKYCPRAVSYRISNGLTDNDTAMAVLIVPMIDARSSGVVYSVDPDCLSRDSVGIYGVSGLGASLVDGSVVPVKASLHRGKEPRPVSECGFDRSGLPDEKMLVQLAKCALKLEEQFGCPQDMEWAVDRGGQFHILQTRPLQQEAHGQLVSPASLNSMPIMDGLERAAGGAGCGEVYFARSGAEISRIPEGAIVVTPALKPSLLSFAAKINGVLSSAGSRASHFGSVAREMGIPVLVGDVSDRLKPGQLVTVDGMAGAVYEGCVEDVLTRSCADTQVSPRVLELYKGMISSMVHLNLVDPHGENFSAEGCESLHDLVRYCHEMAVQEMFSLVDKRGLGMGRSKRLRTELPLVVYLIDLDRGLYAGARSRKELSPADVLSVPMQAFWKGLSDERVVWPEEMTHVDWEEFDRMSAGIFSKDSKLLASYGLLAEDYLHLLVRFGYHFSEVDSLCGDVAAQNYVKFRFKGGGAGAENKKLRLEFVSRVLVHFGFETEIRGDMLDGVSSRLAAADIQKQLVVVGYLMAVTRMMDMRLDNAGQVDREFESFIAAAEGIDG